jgi:hypothetical protein
MEEEFGPNSPDSGLESIDGVQPELQKTAKDSEIESEYASSITIGLFRVHSKLYLDYKRKQNRIFGHYLELVRDRNPNFSHAFS